MSAVLLRREFVMLAHCEGADVRELCRRYRVSPTTGYKWLARFALGGEEGLVDRSRRPRRSPHRTPAAMEAAVLELRQEHDVWGGRKLRRRLQDLGYGDVPAASTITAILWRHGCIDPMEAAKHAPWQRFEAASPNELWQMDFKGHFALAVGRCHPLSVLDDHSRFALGLEACGDERGATVKQRLSDIFRRSGLPARLLADNGGPWGACGARRYTALGVWLIELGISIGHGRPCHPQTQGKDERFHRTLIAELVGRRTFRDREHCQAAFDDWRHVYNFERPHDALHLATPASRYQPSRRSFPETLPPFDYGPDAILRKVQDHGRISFRNRDWEIGGAFKGHTVALRPTTQNGVFAVSFCHQQVATIDLTQP